MPIKPEIIIVRLRPHGGAVIIAFKKSYDDCH